MKSFSRQVGLVVICIILGLGSAFKISAAVNDYLTCEYAYKTGSETVYSGSTGTNSYYISYGADCTSGKLSYTPQVLFDNLTYSDMLGLGGSLEAGESSGTKYASDLAPFKLFRIKLYGLTGRGSGWIQGLN